MKRLMTVLAGAGVLAMATVAQGRPDDWTALGDGERIETARDGEWKLLEGCTHWRRTQDGEIQAKGRNFEFKIPKKSRVRTTRAGHSINLTEGGPPTPTDLAANDEVARLLAQHAATPAGLGMELFPVHTAADGLLSEQMERGVLGLLGATPGPGGSMLLVGSLTADGLTPGVFSLGSGMPYTLTVGTENNLMWTVGDVPGGIVTSLLLGDAADPTPTWVAAAVPGPGSVSLMLLGGVCALRRRR